MHCDYSALPCHAGPQREERRERREEDAHSEWATVFIEEGCSRIRKHLPECFQPRLHSPGNLTHSWSKLRYYFLVEYFFEFFLNILLHRYIIVENFKSQVVFCLLIEPSNVASRSWSCERREENVWVEGICGSIVAKLRCKRWIIELSGSASAVDRQSRSASRSCSRFVSWTRLISPQIEFNSPIFNLSRGISFHVRSPTMGASDREK